MSPCTCGVHRTGEQQDDPYYESDLCFTTIDRLLPPI